LDYHEASRKCSWRTTLNCTGRAQACTRFAFDARDPGTRARR